MIKQTLLFSKGAYLSLRHKQLVIDAKGADGVVTRPLEDIGMIILESHAVTLTSALMAEMMKNNIAMMVCDDKHMPSGLVLPLSGNTLTSEKSKYQIESSLPLKKQLWQQTVMAKISNQGSVLKQVCPKETECMALWSKMVRSGDPDNLEARAAIFYWKNLFKNNPEFKRSDESDPANALLNYGYAILRGVIARALVATGLIPQLGLFHKNKFNSFCLADDIMEPYRPYVDLLVVRMLTRHYDISILSPAIKRELLSIPVMDVEIGKLKRPLMVAASITAASLSKCYCGESRKISYPTINS